MPDTGTIARSTPTVEGLFRACSDRTRLRILNLLIAGETCVCDLMSVLDLPQAKVSRHLAYLRKNGLVRARKQGLWHHYRLASCNSEFHTQLIACLTYAFKGDLIYHRDIKQLKRSDCKSAVCC